MAAGLLLIRLSGLHTEYTEFSDDDEDFYAEDEPEPIADDIVNDDERR